MDELVEKLKVQIIDQLKLEDLSPEDISSSDPLFGPSIGLDSIDALELIVLLEKEYGYKVTDPEQGKEVFYSIDTIADFINKNKAQ